MLRVIFVAAEDFEDFEGVTGLSSQEFWSGCKYKQRLSAKNVMISDYKDWRERKLNLGAYLWYDEMSYLLLAINF